MDASIGVSDDKGASRPADLVPQRPSLEPFIEFSFSAGEAVDCMRCCQKLGGKEAQDQAPSPQGGLMAMSLSSPGFAATGASSKSLKALKRSSSRLKNT